MNESDIKQIIDSLAAERYAYWSEADFQFAFAWAIKERLKGASVKLERRVVDAKDINYYIDIWVELDGDIYTLELKYKTKATSTPIKDKDGANIVLKTHSGCPGNRLLFIKDIARNEIYSSIIPNFKAGFAVMLTNVEEYYDKPETDSYLSCSDGLFRIHEGEELDSSKIIKWQNNKNWQDKYPEVKLKGDYVIKWQKYRHNFKYVIISVLQSKLSPL